MRLPTVWPPKSEDIYPILKRRFTGSNTLSALGDVGNVGCIRIMRVWSLYDQSGAAGPSLPELEERFGWDPVPFLVHNLDCDFLKELVWQLIGKCTKRLDAGLRLLENFLHVVPQVHGNLLHILIQGVPFAKEMFEIHLCTESIAVRFGAKGERPIEWLLISSGNAKNTARMRFFSIPAAKQ